MFSLFEEFNTNLETISDIDIVLKLQRPTGKKLLPIQRFNFFISGSLLMKSLDFQTSVMLF
jgi:hypothetical protein